MCQKPTGAILVATQDGGMLCFYANDGELYRCIALGFGAPAGPLRVAGAGVELQALWLEPAIHYWHMVMRYGSMSMTFLPGLTKAP